VGISWHDAMAYCQWLSGMTGKLYTLPSEAEWEKGGRGTDGRLYPWGNQWEAARRNSRESGLNETTSVHAYPQGAGPYGILDMMGNVWEWTRSLQGGYPYPSDTKERAQREDLRAPNNQARVLRDGAFGFYHGSVRCASRDRDGPSLRARNLGFRVVVLLAF
jgi:formylglycine-generating enzyme required for sulfatase activity